MIRVLHPGLLSTVQDLGRPGFRQYGVPSGGAADRLSHIIANQLVGNAPSEATVEMTLIGATFFFEEDAVIGICGGDMQPTIDGTDVPMWKPVGIRAGDKLSFREAVRGCRTYLAIAGGIDVPPVMGSLGTDLRGAFGGFQGRPIQSGDVIALRKSEAAVKPIRPRQTVLHRRSGLDSAPWAACYALRTHTDATSKIRILPGQHAEQFGASWGHMVETTYQVSPQSDRMGIRLVGKVLTRSHGDEIVSFGVAPGTIQVPPSGQPVILMADAQVTGGYPIIANVASVDLPALAQRRPGQSIVFAEITQTEAQAALRAQARDLRELALAISWKLQ